MSLPRIEPAEYGAQLAAKVEKFKSDFAPFALPEPAVHASAPQNYRMRAEFRVWHDHDRVDRVGTGQAGWGGGHLADDGFGHDSSC